MVRIAHPEMSKETDVVKTACSAYNQNFHRTLKMSPEKAEIDVQVCDGITVALILENY